MNTEKNKIQIEAKYIKISSKVIKDLIKHRKLKNDIFEKVDFFMVGNGLEAHFSDGVSLKIGDIDWRPAHSI